MNQNCFLGFSLLAIIIVAGSCNDPGLEIKLVDKFPVSIQLNGEQLFSDQYELISIETIDSLIVLSTFQETLFHVYNKKGEYVSGFGKKGKGPGEFENYPYIEDIRKTKNDVELLFFNPSKLKAININLSSSILKKQLVVEEEFEVPYEFRQPVLNILFLDEKRFIGRFDDRFHKRLNELSGGFIYSKEVNHFEIFSLQNLSIQPYDAIPEINLNNNVIKISRDRKKMAVAMMYSPLLTVFSLDAAITGQKQYLLESEPPTNPYNLDDFEEQKYPKYTEHMFVSNDFLYLLYSGETSDYDNPKNKKIRVFDWSGESRAQYLIPAEYRLSWITVDEKNQVIYGLSWENDAVYKFDFSEF